MMVNCPKCGFSQPKDQYCANCGVNMVAYRPTRKPVIYRFLRSTSVQVSTLLVLAALGGFYVHQKNANLLSQRISEIENAPSTTIVQNNGQYKAASPEGFAEGELPQSDNASEMKNESELVQPDEASRAAAVSSLTASGTTGAPPPIAPAPAGGATPGAVSPSAATGSSPAAQATTVRVAFAEVQRAFLGEILDTRNGVSGGTLGPTLMYAIVPAIEAKISSGRAAWVSVDASSAETIRVGQPAIVYRGTRDEATGQNLGVTVQALPTLQDEAGTHFQVELMRVLRDPNAQPPIEALPIQIPENLVVPSGSAIVISGLMPRRPIAEADARAYTSANVLRILTSEAFKAGTTEFVIVIQPK